MPQSLPEPNTPGNFTVVGVANGLGRYILAHDKFFVSDQLHLTSRFQRDLTAQDDVYLGLLSVIFIAVFSEILHTFILRSTRDSSQSRFRLVCAFLMSEFAHFRNVLRYCYPIHRIIIRPTSPSPSLMGIDNEHVNNHTTPSTGTQALSASLTFRLSSKILFLTFLLFAADFLSIFYTQTSPVFSAAQQYNLRAFHPSRTTLGQSRYIRRLVGERPCVAPFMITNDTTRMRNFQLLTCVQLSFGGGLNADVHDSARSVSVESYFHSGGSDHTVTYGAGFASVSVRAQVAVSKSGGGARRLLFQSLDDPGTQFNARHIHNLTVHAAAEWVCRKQGKGNEDWCRILRGLYANGTGPDVSVTQRRREVYLWRGKIADVYENVTGVVSTFENIRLPNATGAFNAGVRWLVSCGFVEEVDGPGDYVQVLNDEHEDGIRGLLTEHGRKLGVLSMLIAVTAALGAMLALRQCLRPISLGEVVIRRLDDDQQLRENSLRQLGANEMSSGSEAGYQYRYDAARKGGDTASFGETKRMHRGDKGDTWTQQYSSANVGAGSLMSQSYESG